jgi:hypothetical protein
VQHQEGMPMHLLNRVFATVVALAISSVSAHAGLAGQTLSAQYFYPDLSSPYALAPFVPPTFVVGPGVETVGDVEGVTTLTVDFSDSDLLLTLNTILTNPTWGSASFNGPVFTSTTALDIVSATNTGATTLVGFDDSRISFNATQLFLNWQGLSYQNGDVVSIHFESVTNVPEPMTIALLGAGIVAIGVSRRRGRKLISPGPSPRAGS